MVKFKCETCSTVRIVPNNFPLDLRCCGSQRVLFNRPVLRTCVHCQVMEPVKVKQIVSSKHECGSYLWKIEEAKE